MIIQIFLFVVALFLIYKTAVRNFKYWEERGVPFVKPAPFFGNLYETLSFRTHFALLLSKLYNQLKQPYFGIFLFNKPCLVVKDPNLIKSVLVKDFNNFCDRSTVVDEKCDPMCSKFLFFVKNPEWKIVRNKVTPVFTSGKIKNMVVLINEIAEEMETYIEKELRSGSLEAKELCAKYATDCIATCAFGIQARSFQLENAAFRMIGRKMFDFNFVTAGRQLFYFVFPDLVKFLRLPFFDTSVTSFMRDVFWRTLKEREKTNYKRNDLIDILIHLRNTWNEENFKFEGDRVVAQAGQFYAAGFETISAAMSFVLYELCLNKSIQNKVRAEIYKSIENYGGFTFEAEQSMKYLQMVVCESMRKYPPLPFLDRLCTEDYKVPDSNFVIEKGTSIFIPIYGLHNDPEYFPCPEKFNPDRFSGEIKEDCSGFVYMPFGNGPRNCIGARFGLMVVKLGLAHILSRFEVERNKDTPVPLKFQNKGLLLGSTVGLPMEFKKVKNDFEEKFNTRKQ